MSALERIVYTDRGTALTGWLARPKASREPRAAQPALPAGHAVANASTCSAISASDPASILRRSAAASGQKRSPK